MPRTIRPLSLGDNTDIPIPPRWNDKQPYLCPVCRGRGLVPAGFYGWGYAVPINHGAVGQCHVLRAGDGAEKLAVVLVIREVEHL